MNVIKGNPWQVTLGTLGDGDFPTHVQKELCFTVDFTHAPFHNVNISRLKNT